MTLQQLKYAVAVADCRNITEASRRVFVSQPSLTAAIRELENEMGITLFLRSNKGVSVTNEGDEFLSYARQVLEQANLLEDRFKGNVGGNTIFSVSCQHYSFAVNAFVDVIRQFGGNEYDFTLAVKRNTIVMVVHSLLRIMVRLGRKMGRLRTLKVMVLIIMIGV